MGTSVQRPNILLFMPETLRADAVLGPVEHRARTPNMDRLRGEGSAFSRCFAQNPICSPSRCSMFSGFYPHTWGHRSLLSLLKPNQRNLFRDLRDAGYYNVVFGKNDLLSPESIPLCFDEVGCRVKPEAPKTFDPEIPGPGNRWEKTFYRGKRKHEDCHDGDWACVESALQFLDKPLKQPFCVYLPLNFVHPLYRVEEPFFSMHDLASVPEPIPARHEGKRGYMKALHKAHGVDALGPDDWKEIKRVYFGMTSRIDYQLGLLIEKLKARKLYDNTLVVVFSDHGDYTGDYGMVEKFLAGFEDCLMRVPLILRGPGVPVSAEKDTLCQMTDLYPTLLELTGLTSKHHHFGRSLCPVMRGEVSTHREMVFAEGGYRPDERKHFNVEMPPAGTQNPYEPMGRALENHPELAERVMMIRTDRWKYVFSPCEHDELFDLTDDPHELKNLSGNPACASVVAELRGQLLKWMLHTGDALPPERDPRGWKAPS